MDITVQQRQALIDAMVVIAKGVCADNNDQSDDGQFYLVDSKSEAETILYEAGI